jgi:hypothetical protein
MSPPNAVRRSDSAGEVPRAAAAMTSAAIYDRIEMS